MAASAPHTIRLRTDGAIRTEGAAKSGEAIYPGMLVERHTDGTIKKHATAAGVATPMFAVEADIYGDNIDTAYADGEQVLMDTFQKGDWVYAFVETGANVAIGALLESNGAGFLQANTAFAQSGTTPFAVTPQGAVVARALEAVDNSGGGSGPSGSARIKVEIV